MTCHHLPLVNQGANIGGHGLSQQAPEFRGGVEPQFAHPVPSPAPRVDSASCSVQGHLFSRVSSLPWQPDPSGKVRLHTREEKQLLCSPHSLFASRGAK